MLTSYELSLRAERPASVRAEWAYRLYAALMEQAPVPFADAVHLDAVTPVSQFLQVERDGGLLWTVNLLGAESERALAPLLDGLERLFLEKDRLILSVTARRARRVADVEELLARGETRGGVHRLYFRTATAFKSQGQYLNLPNSRLIVQSLIKKWNGCFGEECPIEDEDGEGMDALAAGLRACQFRLYDHVFFLKGRAIPGFAGELTLENRLSGFQGQLADVLLQFSSYAGVGIKTALGMGGVEHRLVER